MDYQYVALDIGDFDRECIDARCKYEDFDAVAENFWNKIKPHPDFMINMIFSCNYRTDFMYFMAKNECLIEQFNRSSVEEQIEMLTKFVATVEVEQPVDEDHNDVDPDEEDAPFFHDQDEIECDYITKHNITQAPAVPVQPKQRANIPTVVLVLVWIFFPLVGAAMMLYNWWNSD